MSSINFEQLKQNLQNVCNGNIETLKGIKLIGDEIVRSLIDQQINKNLPEDLLQTYKNFVTRYAKGINESFDSVILLAENDKFKDCNFIIRSIIERVHIILYVSRKIDSEQNLDVLLVKLPIKDIMNENLDWFNSPKFDLTNNVLNDDYLNELDSFSFSDNKEGNLSYVQKKFSEAFSFFADTVSKEVNSEELDNSIRDIVKTDENQFEYSKSTSLLRVIDADMDHFINYIGNNFDLLLSNQIDFENFKEALEEKKEYLRIRSESFLLSALKMPYDVVLLNRVYSINNKISAIYFYIDKATKLENKELVYLRRLMNQLITKTQIEVNYNWQVIDHFVFSIRFTYIMLQKQLNNK